MTYDPEARRDTPLALKLKERIRRDGPITVTEYMQECLHDPEFGYYRRMPAIGAAGDFVTAPEISQVFGELIGLWCAVVWQQMGSPEVVHLVELGPGRGTMMRDALRAARVLPGFLQAVRVHLVESNTHLREVQRETLAAAAVPIDWVTDVVELPVWGAAPQSTIVLANEFLDAFAIEQAVYRDGVWRERCVGIDAAGGLVFLEGNDLVDFEPLGEPSHRSIDGDIDERCPGHLFVATVTLAGLLNLGPTAGLFIDYGHLRSQIGDTFQAVCRQAAVSPLYAPGESDLTAQVDFELFGRCCRQVAAVDGPVTQAEFLGSLGIVERASRLMAANPAKAGEIETGVARLIAPNAMGSRFKAIGIRTASLPPLPGFPISGKT